MKLIRDSRVGQRNNYFLRTEGHKEFYFSLFYSHKQKRNLGSTTSYRSAEQVFRTSSLVRLSFKYWNSRKFLFKGFQNQSCSYDRVVTTTARILRSDLVSNIHSLTEYRLSISSCFTTISAISETVVNSSLTVS